jgi:ribosomal protein S18 acetylase RimI-like enzyme
MLVKPFYHTKIDEDPTARPAYRDAFRRLGALGLAGRAWSASVGRLLDVRILFECELSTASARFGPVPGFSFAAVATERDPESAEAAARILGVRLSERRSHQLFVARDAGGRIAGCTWNEPAEDRRARHRGVGVAAGCRGRGLAPALLAFQAAQLGREGAAVVLIRTTVGNRASRRMLHKAGVRLVSIRALILLAGRRVGLHELTGRPEAFLRRRWERERHGVETSEPAAAVVPAAGRC